MIGVIVGYIQSSDVNEIVTTVGHALYDCHDREMEQVVPVLHPDSIKFYIEKLEPEILDKFTDIVEILNVRECYRMPRNHIIFSTKESVYNDSTSREVDRSKQRNR